MRKKKYYFGKNKLGKQFVHHYPSYPRALRPAIKYDILLLLAERSLTQRLETMSETHEYYPLLTSLLEDVIEARTLKSYPRLQQALTRYRSEDPVQVYRRQLFKRANMPHCKCENGTMIPGVCRKFIKLQSSDGYAYGNFNGITFVTRV